MTTMTNVFSNNLNDHWTCQKINKGIDGYRHLSEKNQKPLHVLLHKKNWIHKTVIIQVTITSCQFRAMNRRRRIHSSMCICVWKSKEIFVFLSTFYFIFTFFVSLVPVIVDERSAPFNQDLVARVGTNKPKNSIIVVTIIFELYVINFYTSVYFCLVI